jgi:hypothetical protein
LLIASAFAADFGSANITFFSPIFIILMEPDLAIDIASDFAESDFDIAIDPIEEDPIFVIALLIGAAFIELMDIADPIGAAFIELIDMELLAMLLLPPLLLMLLPRLILLFVYKYSNEKQCKSK